jgi:hypothetical protein
MLNYVTSNKLLKPYYICFFIHKNEDNSINLILWRWQ